MSDAFEIEMQERRADDWAIRNVIGEYFEAFSDEPFTDADALTRQLWEAGFVIVRNYRP